MPRIRTAATLPLALLALLTAGVVAGPASAAHADVDDFRFASMDAKYSLSTDSAGHSTLTTVETLVAEFPETDQNHGIRRTLVDRYDGHPTDLHVKSVTDGNGTARAFTVEDDDGTAVTSRADGFVHGDQTYVITYTQENVTLQRSDSGNDEFYGDVNGTDWPQEFGRVTAEVTVTPKLAQALTGDLAAAQGVEGSTQKATITQTGPRTITASADNLAAHENLTFAIGFTAGTFAPRAAGVFDSPWPVLALIFAVIALLALLAAFLLRRGRLADAPGRPTIVAEYLPPEGITLPFGGYLMRRVATSAELLQLAVAGHLRLIENEGKGRKRFAMEFVGADGASDDDLVFLHALFGDPLVPGKRRDVVDKNRNAITRIQSLYRTLPARSVTEGYKRGYDRRAIAGVLVPAAAGSLGAVVFGIIALATVFGGFWPIVAIVVGIGSGVTSPVLVVRRAFTARGAEARDHLLGLALYVRQAEADRLSFLQSPEGAPVMTDGSVEWLRLNERLLPWAALIGEQKRWTKELGRHYEQDGSQPGWYSGQSAFTPAIFAGAVGGFTSATTSSFSATSGGSTGGVSSGGGGGGGGGGGV